MRLKSFNSFIIVFVYLLVAASFANALVEKENNLVEANEAYSGGVGTIFTENKNAYSLPLKNLKPENRIDFFVGNSLFRRIWVPPSEVSIAKDGLGPFFNSNSCDGCHINDGRGHPPNESWPNDDAVSLVLALSIPPQDDFQRILLDQLKIKSIPDPNYGSQLSDFAITGVKPEGNVMIEYEYFPILFDNGEIINLRKPIYSISNLNYGNLHPEINISARIAQPLIGLGLIESIKLDDILAYEDPDDLDGDGISGKANRLFDSKENRVLIGRFGWKASQPSLLSQTFDATYNDMGLSSTYTSKMSNCTEIQKECQKLINGNSETYDGVEVSNEQLDLMVFYQRHLSPPGRRNINNPNVLAGKKIFFNSGCNSCHVQKYTTKKTAKSLALSDQLIWPYSDFLLHDMGDELGDNLNEYMATGNEWRTPPLWGIGLAKNVNGQINLLHDGRAKSILEAILWHGGEAKKSQQKVLNLSKVEVDQLIEFIESL